MKRWLKALAALMMVVSGGAAHAAGAPAKGGKTTPSASPRSARTITLPIAAAWMYMSDDKQYKTIPPEWSSIDFKKVDVLNVGPGGIQADGTFGLYNSASTGDLANRFKWIIQTARGQNPNIKIIVSQWWGDGNGVWGNALAALNTDDAINKYTDSVIAFLKSYLSVSGGVDGYDIDYESNNVTDNIAKILSQLRTKLDALSKANGGRPFYLTVSPATIDKLSKAVVAKLNFVNMQTYAGGQGLTPQDFTQLLMKPQQLLYGICPEDGPGCNPPSSPQDDSLAKQAKSQYSQNGLAGIHLWRLNSKNYTQEIQVQAQVYDLLHPKK